jgi:N-acetylglucosaminyl-diphospho-decaprenol L-rhamnosyltransferase
MVNEPRLVRPRGGESGGRPDLSVVIVNRNTRALLHALLDSLDAQDDDGVRFELIVVDNGSTDGSLDGISARKRVPRVIRNPDNAGYARANNQGLAIAAGRYLLLLNSDTVVPPGALEGLVRWMDLHPHVGACGPALRAPDGEIQRSCSSFATPWRWFCDLSGLGGLFPRSRRFANLNRRFDHAATAAVDWLIGAALVARREAVEEVGLLDEQFWIYCNDSDWCRRFWNAGWEVWFVHEIEIFHHGSATIALESRDGALQQAMMRNHLDLQRKYYGRSAEHWLRLWLVLGCGLRAVLLSLPGSGGRQAEGAPLRRDLVRMARLALRGPGRALPRGASR